MIYDNIEYFNFYYNYERLHLIYLRKFIKCLCKYIKYYF